MWQKNEKAVFAGGCFWCLEAVFIRLHGVTSVRSGYAGGDAADPTYEAVSTGTTGHAEAVEVGFDPSVITYDDLLDVFFGMHDPTTRNRQGNDIGTQYRSAIFFADKGQERAAREKISELTDEKTFDDPIVTEVEPLEKFYPAESVHARYYDRNPEAGYCQAVINPKVAKLRKKYAHLLRADS